MYLVELEEEDGVDIYAGARTEDFPIMAEYVWNVYEHI